MSPFCKHHWLETVVHDPHFNHPNPWGPTLALLTEPASSTSSSSSFSPLGPHGLSTTDLALGVTVHQLLSPNDLSKLMSNISRTRSSKDLIMLACLSALWDNCAPNQIRRRKKKIMPECFCQHVKRGWKALWLGVMGASLLSDPSDKRKRGTQKTASEKTRRKPIRFCRYKHNSLQRPHGLCAVGHWLQIGIQAQGNDRLLDIILEGLSLWIN